MRTLVKVHKRTTTGAGQVTNSPPQYLLRDAGGTCQQDVDTFNGIAEEVKSALTTSIPATETAWNIRSCSEVESQPAVVTPYPDVEFTTAVAHTIQIPAGNFTGGNLVFTGTRGDLDPLRDSITFYPATRTFTMPASLTDEYYIFRIVATNSVGSIADVFAVRLAYNAGTVSDSLEVTVLSDAGENTGTPGEVPDYETEGEIGGTFDV